VAITGHLYGSGQMEFGSHKKQQSHSYGTNTTDLGSQITDSIIFFQHELQSESIENKQSAPLYMKQTSGIYNMRI